jgi:hypothetical protein
MSSEVTMVVGVGAVNPLVVIRVPVTTIVAASDRSASLLAAGEPVGGGDPPVPAAVWP